MRTRLRPARRPRLRRAPGDRRRRVAGRGGVRPGPRTHGAHLAAAVPADRGGGGAGRAVRRHPGLAGRHLRRQAVRGVVRLQRPGGRPHRVPRRPAGRGRPAVHRRRRGAGGTHLRQCRRHPPPPLPGLTAATMTTPYRDTGTGWPDPEPTPEPEPAAEPLPARGARVPPLSPAGAVVGLLLVLLGFALVVQLRSNATDPELAAARPEDLVRILSDLDARQSRLRQEIASLEESRRQLASGAQGREAALAEARRRADQLGILAGTLPAEGPGLSIRFNPGTERIRAETILDAVEELRGAGGEAMQIAGATGGPVRIVASTSFVAAGDELLVEGQRLTAPYTIVVIGDPQTMQTALNIPGGVADTVRRRGGTVNVQAADLVQVTALHQAGTPKYARPVS